MDLGCGLPRLETLENRTLLASSPTVATTAATGIMVSSASLNGTVNPNGGTVSAAFEYGTDPSLAPKIVTTVAGAGNIGSGPGGVAFDAATGDIYVANTGNDTILKITPAGVITTVAGKDGIAGSDDGTGAAATFNQPFGIAVDPATENVYVADTSNDTIRMISPAGVVTTLAGTAAVGGSADGTGSAASFDQPRGIAVDPTTGNVYVADSFNSTIRMITPAGVVATLAGSAGNVGDADGTGSAASFARPTGIAVDPTTGNVYVAASGNETIRMITPAGVVTTLAGSGNIGHADGTGAAASFLDPSAIAVDPATGTIYVADAGNDSIRQIAPGGVVTTLAGTAGTFGNADGTGSAATFFQPLGITVGPTGTIYVADTRNGSIRRMSTLTAGAQSGLTGNSAQPVNAAVTGLSPGTTYYFRAVALTGTPQDVVGSIVSFSTPALAPAVTTQAAGTVTATGATLNASVNPQGFATTVQFIYGTDPTLTNGTTTVPVPALSAGSGTSAVPASEPVTGLEPGTTYYFEAVATNGVGTTDGAILSFTTLALAPVATTQAAGTVTARTATLIASVNPEGAATTVQFIYGTDPTLTNGTTTSAGQSIGSGTIAVAVNDALTGLQPGTTYFFEAVATNGVGTTDGAILSFTTLALAPVATTQAAGTVKATTATLNASVNPEGAATDVQFIYGTDPTLTNGTTTVPSPALSAGSGTSAVPVSEPVTGLQPGTTYYFEVVATNGVGTTDGAILSFTTFALAPVATTQAAGTVKATTATLIASVTPEGAATTVQFIYGTDPTLTNGTTTVPSPALSAGHGTSAVPVGEAVTGLQPVTTYYFEVIANNSVGTTDGTILNFTTPALPVAPTATTQAATSITATGAGLNASVNPRGFPTTVEFVYGTDPTLTNGTTTSTAQLIGSGTSAVPVNDPLTGLQSGTTYYFEVAANNSGGTTDGPILSFATPAFPPSAAAVPASSLNPTGATLNAVLNPRGSATTVQFVYGTDPTLTNGTKTTAAQSIGSGTSAVPVNDLLTGLEPGTTYYFMVTANNAGGTTDSVILRFATPAHGATVTTTAASGITANGATLNGTVNPNGTTASAAFQYGTDPSVAPNIVTTLAGTAATPGTSDGTGSAASFSSPFGVAVDSATGDIYVADSNNDTIRMITPAGVVTTLAGTAGKSGHADGKGTAATFAFPFGIAVDPATGNVYVTDTDNNAVRQITPAGVVTTLAGTPGTTGHVDGTGAAASFDHPTGIAVDPSTGNVYVADTDSDTIRQITSAGVVTTLAGSAGSIGSSDGTGAAATFNGPAALAEDPATGTVYVADSDNNTIRQVTSAGVVTTLAGTPGASGHADGIGAAATFNDPLGIAVDRATGNVYVADGANGTIRLIAPGGVVTTLAGTAGRNGSDDGTGGVASFSGPSGVAVNSETGTVYVADALNSTIRQLSPLTAGAQSGLTGNSAQPVNAALTSLSPGTTYYFRAVASTGTPPNADGGIQSFTTLAAAPVATTLAARSVAATSATLHASVSPESAETGVEFIYGTDATLTNGTTTVPSHALSVGNGTTNVQVDEPVTGLKPATTYYFEVVANNSVGTAEGAILSFATAAQGPTVTTTAASGITDSGATLNGAVNPNGTTANVVFEYGTDPSLVPKVVTTLAGMAGMSAFSDGTGSAARFADPFGVAVDSATGDIYVADTFNSTIRKITPTGVVTTLAGTGGTVGHADGTGSGASFEVPYGVAVDPATGNVYVADTGNDTIRMITPKGVVTTLAGSAGNSGHADGTGSAASFDGPNGIAVDPTTGNVYVADTFNGTIRRITPAGVVTTLAGTPGTTGHADGTGVAASFDGPTGIAVDATTGNLYVADTDNNTIRQITPAGVVTTLAGSAGYFGSSDGTGAAASFQDPEGIAVDPATGNVYVADKNNDMIRLIAPGGVVTTLAGTAKTFGRADGTGAAASFYTPAGVAVNSATGTVYVADTLNSTIRQLSTLTAGAQSGLTGNSAQPVNAGLTGLLPGTTYYFRAVASAGTLPNTDGGIQSFTTPAAAPVATTLAARNATATSATLNASVNPDGADTTVEFIFGTDPTLTNGTTTVPSHAFSVGSGSANVPFSEPVTGLKPGTTYYFEVVATNSASTTDGAIFSFATTAVPPTVTTTAASGITATGATLNGAVNPNGTTANVAFEYGTDPSLGPNTVTTLAGVVMTPGSNDGTGAAAGFNSPEGVAVDTTTGDIYVADTGNGSIRIITPAGMVTTLAGGLSGPSGVAVDPATGNVYVADSGDATIRIITPAGVVTTLAGTAGKIGDADGTGAAASFDDPTGIAFDRATGTIYVADTGNNTIRQVTSAGVVTTLAGTAGTAGFSDGTGAAASFNSPEGLAVDPTTGTIYVADAGNDTIREITPTGVVTTLAGNSAQAGFADGTGSAATFFKPYGIAEDPATGTVYVADEGGDTIRQVTSASVVKTLAGEPGARSHADGTGFAASFFNPWGLAVNPATNTIYVADTGNDTIRQLSALTAGAQSGLTGNSAQPVNAGLTGLLPGTTYYFRAVVSTGTSPNTDGGIQSFTTPALAPVATTLAARNVTATGAALRASVNPEGADTSFLFNYGTDPTLTSDTNTTLSPAGSTFASVVVQPLAGLQPGTTYYFQVVAINSIRTAYGAILSFTTALSPTVTTTAATGITDTGATLNGTVNPSGTTTNAAFEYGTDPSLAPNIVTTVAGAGNVGSQPQSVAFDTATGDIYVANTNNDTILKITPAGVVTTVAGKDGVAGSADGTGTAATFDNPVGIAVDPATGNLYVTDSFNNTIRMITPAGVVTTLAGKAGTRGFSDGTGAAAGFDNPTGIAFEPTTGYLYVADTANDTIRQIAPGGVVTTLAGVVKTAGHADGTGAAATFQNPAGLAVDPQTGNIYVADTFNNIIREISPAGVVTTLAGNPASFGHADGTGAVATFEFPLGVAVDSTTGNVYVSDSGNDTIRMITRDGVVTTLAGQVNTAGDTNGIGTAATFNGPAGLAVNSATGTVYVVDGGNGSVRQLSALTAGAQSGLTGKSAQPVDAAVTGLLPGTTYYFRAVATGALPGDDGGILSFTTATPPVAPAAATQAATSVTATGATLHASVNPDRADTTVEFIYGTDPTLTNGTTTVPSPALSVGNGTSSVPVDEALTGLQPGTTYYFEVVATNSVGTADGAILSFATPALAPTATTQAATSLSTTGATLNASVNPQGFATTVHFVYGTDPTLKNGTTTSAQSIGLGTSTVSLTAALAGLQPGTTYYFEVVASNSGGTADGAILSFATPTVPSTATTEAATNVTSAGATLNASVNPQGFATTVDFVYGTDSTLKNGTTTVPSPGRPVGNGTIAVPVDEPLIGLQPGTTYYFEIVATSSGGTTDGGILSFATPAVAPVGPVAPTATTQAATSVTSTSATLNASVDPQGFTTTVEFVYGTDPTLKNGTTTVPSSALAVGNGTIAVPVDELLTGLKPGTTYYFEIVATNSGGTTDGAILSFATPAVAPAGPVAPTATTQAATSVASNGATLNADVNPQGFATTIEFIYGTDPGLTKGTITVPSPSRPVGDGTIAVPVDELLTGLQAATTYYFEVVASNAGGTTDGAILSFATPAVARVAPTATTQAATSITSTGATLHASVDPQGFAATVAFVYGTDPTLKNGTTTVPSPALAVGNGTVAVPVDEPLSGLQPGTTYYFEVVATNNGGTADGSILSFATPAVPAVAPSATTQAATSVTSTGATLNATVDPQGFTTSVQFIYGTDPTLTNGTTTSAGQSIGSGTSAVPVNDPLTALNPGTTYYFEVVATNSGGTTDGAILSFATPAVPPTATTQAATSITGTGATLNASVNPQGFATTVHFVYGTAPNLTTGTTTAEESIGAGTTAVAVTPTLTGLQPGATYYFEVVASNSAGTVDGTILSFATPAVPAVAPTATTQAATSITSAGATLNASVNPQGFATTVHFVYGTDPTLTAGTISVPSPALAVGNGTIAVPVDEPLTGLLPGTTYYFEVVATNSGGTTDGSILNFDSPAVAPVAPTATTKAATSVTSTGAMLNASVSPQGFATAVDFVYGTDPTLKIGTITVPSPTLAVGNGTIAVPADEPLTGLQPGTTYYYAVVASNAGGTTDGSILSFATPAVVPAGPVAPTAATQAATSVTATGATLNASVNPQGFATTVEFIYGTDPSLKNGTVTVPSPSRPVGDGTIAVPVDEPLTGLQPGTTYYFEVVASNAGGTTDGAILSFATPAVVPVGSVAPTATTQAATSVTSTGATLNATVDPQGFTTTIQFIYGTDPTLANGTTTSAGQSIGSGTSAVPVNDPLTALNPGTTYYFEVVATNSGGTTDGAILSFATPAVPPTATTQAATSITGTGATLHASVNPQGFATTVHFVYGTDPHLTTGTTTAEESIGAGTTAVAVTPTLSGLQPGATYYFEVVASNSAGTIEGSILSFATPAVAPTATTQAATSVTATGATLSATVNPQGFDTSAYFVYGTDPTLTTSTTQIPLQALSIGNGTIGVSAVEPVSGLLPGTTYYFRLVATNAAGTTSAGILSFSTTARPVTTPAFAAELATNVTSTTATLAALVGPNGAPTTVLFVYGTMLDLANGTTIGAEQSVGSGTTAVSAATTLTGLQPGTTYYFAAVAIRNGVATAGPVEGFTTAAAPAGPLMVKLQRFGYGMQPTKLVLTFDEALDPTSAQDVNNYHVVPMRGGHAGRAIAIASAVYDATNHTVTLTTVKPVSVRARYQLTVIGTPPLGVSSTSGQFLQGQGSGHPGTNDVTTFGASILAGPNFPSGIGRAFFARITRTSRHELPNAAQVAAAAETVRRASIAAASSGHQVAQSPAASAHASAVDAVIASHVVSHRRRRPK